MRSRWLYHIIINSICLGLPFLASGQKDADPILYHLSIDTISVVADPSFDLEEFLDLIIKDSSVYKAFAHMRSMELAPEVNYRAFNRKNQPTDSTYGIYIQHQSPDCRWTTGQTTARFSPGMYKKGKAHRYYSYQMLESAFLAQDSICNGPRPKPRRSRFLRHYTELKKLIFFPTQKPKIPMMGKKTQFFSPRMQRFYDYRLSDTLYLDSLPAYLFSATVKNKYKRAAYQNHTVIKDYSVMVSKGDFQVLSKKYHLDYNSGLYDLDVRLHISLRKDNETGYYPRRIEYEGNWKLPFRKRERARFTLITDPVKDVSK